MDEETKKELARYKRYSAALEKEVKELRETLERIDGEFEKDEISSFQIKGWIYDALKGGGE